MRKIYLLLLSAVCFGSGNVFSQSILNPADSVVTYNPASPPQQPAYGTIGKWVRTKKLSWNTNQYKAYIYNGRPFRLLFPKTYNPTANDGKKYPMMVFFHGVGEGDTSIYDNEYQLYHGGDVFQAAVNSGNFDGYILCMQTGSLWGTVQYQDIVDIINYMITNNKLDPFAVSDNGLSGGGEGTWEMLLNHPTYIDAAIPMSFSSVYYASQSTANIVKFTPMWLFQGGLDGSPAPYTSQQVVDTMLTYGGDFTYTVYSTLGHGTWDSAWQEPNFWSYQLAAYASNPWTLTGRTAFCASDTIKATIGLAPGFDAYQWEKDGVLISGATGNTISVTNTGTYSARVERGSLWSDWSRTPVQITIKGATVTPPIVVAGLMSPAIPDPSGINYVNLQVPNNNYTSFTWKQAGNSTVLATTPVFKATSPGQYQVAVTELYGCSSIYSPAFTVIDATGKNAPPPATGLTALPLSNTKMQLNWSNNPSPAYNETAFEVYRSVTSGNSYKYIGKVPADTINFTDSNLAAGATYYYVIRAINNNGASALSNQATGITSSDQIPPTAPNSLTIISTTNTTVNLSWDSSTDNVGVVRYDIYVNGIKTNSTTQTSFAVAGLASLKQFSFYVKAIDASGNASPKSNQVSAATALAGFRYNYYENVWTALPDFNTVTVVKSGYCDSITLALRNHDVKFGFVWQGYIKVPVTGTYKFETYSDDGSMLWLDKYDYTEAPLVNNDSQHVAKYAAGTVTLRAGVYPISVAYFQKYNSQVLKLYWTCSNLYGDTLRHLITSNYFNDVYKPADTVPAAPGISSANALSYTKIKVFWVDNSSKETGFEVYRSAGTSGNYNIIATTAANIVSYTDSGLTASTAYFYKIKAINNVGSSAFSSYKNTSTNALPAAPAAATGVKATVLSSLSINITWKDNATNETGYSVYKSTGDSLHYKLSASLPANQVSYTDSSLYGHIIYYYKISTLGVGGTSSVSKAVSAKTLDNKPVITQVTNRSVRYGITTNIPLSATDADGDTLTFTLKTPPAFAAITNNGNNTAAITLNPTTLQGGTYTIRAIVNDNYGGIDSAVFTITVGANYDPTIDSIINYTINENDSLNINVNAHDLNKNSLSFTLSGASANSYITKITDSTATIHIRSNYASSGTYTVVVTANDGQGGMVTRQFILNILEKSPVTTIYTRFADQDTIGSPWNNIKGVTTANLKDTSNNVTKVSLNIQGSWYATYNAGPSTGNNSGIYPDAVLKDYYYFGYNGGPDSVTVIINGLDTTSKYSLSFYAGSIFNGTADNGNTTYTVGNQTVSLYVQNNTKNIVSINNIKPDATGAITFKMGKASNALIGYLNALIINSVYDDGTKPISPYLVSAQAVTAGVKLVWNDLAYNELNYQVYRSSSLNGTYTLIDTTVANATSYTDTSVTGNAQYYYELKAGNSYGSSAFSNAAGVYVYDKVPTLSAISSMVIKNSRSVKINVVAHDDAADHVTLTASQLPSFVTFADNGNGTGTFNISPGVGVIGYYQGVTITGTDKSDSTVTESFDITVTDSASTGIYLNFTDPTTLAAKPWNNLSNYPVSGVVYSGITDQDNNLTSINVTLVNGFQGVVESGMQSGNLVYPETVVRGGVYEGTSTVRTIKISGLSQAKKYNFIFFNSHEDGYNGFTNFTVNGQTVSLNASYNINKTVEINRVSADVNGQVTISVAKDSSAAYAYLSSLVIESYDSSSMLPPSNLIVTGTTRNTISMQWNDRGFNETGFQVLRADDSSGQYVAIKLLPPNTTSFTDSNLPSNKAYYYAVRAVTAYGNSPLSNVVTAHTYSYAIYINFTTTQLGHSPWNNTASPPQNGNTFNNFLDEDEYVTSVGMNVTSDFAGEYTDGVKTGNNSGIYPDSVMAESYGLFAGQTGNIQITGLNHNMKYNFTFFASSQEYGNINVAYVVNGVTAILDASLNSKGTVTINNILPDSNGNVSVSIAPASTASVYGLIGALVVQGFDSSAAPVPQPPVNNKIRIIQKSANQSDIYVENKTGDIQIKAYPNPFINRFNLSVSAKQGESINVEVYDVSGKLVYVNKFANLFNGENTMEIQPPVSAAGIYIIKVIFGNKKTTKVLSVLKQ